MKKLHTSTLNIISAGLSEYHRDLIVESYAAHSFWTSCPSEQSYSYTCHDAINRLYQKHGNFMFGYTYSEIRRDFSEALKDMNNEYLATH